MAESPQESLLLGGLSIYPAGEDAGVEGDEEVGSADGGNASAACGSVFSAIGAIGEILSNAAS